MIKTLHTILLIIYTSGTLMLPLGNFSALRSLPEMYTHCKMMEDRDMTVIDFITDHLLNIDGVFDKHKGNDEQKPHNPLPNHSIPSFFAFESGQVSFSMPKQSYLLDKKVFPLVDDIDFHSDYSSGLFRPPITA